jgi:hypothetical protein
MSPTVESMKGLAGTLLLVFPLAAPAQQPHEQEIQRALIQLDQRSAEFAAGAPSQPLPADVGRPLHPDPEIARQWRPYERMKLAEQREANVLRLPPPVVRRRDEKPLPLPGGPRAGVDVVTAPRVAD